MGEGSSEQHISSDVATVKTLGPDDLMSLLESCREAKIAVGHFCNSHDTQEHYDALVPFRVASVPE